MDIRVGKTAYLTYLLNQQGLMSKVAKIRFSDYSTSVTKALDAVEAAKKLPGEGLIILKPNLVNTSPPPVTTNLGAVEAVYEYCRRHTQASIAIAEGCGSGRTPDVFDELGYTKFAEDRGIELIDLNEAPAVELRNPDALVLEKFQMPEILVDAFVISIPVLKHHSFTGTTIAMKNMFGIAPERFYKNGWNKGKLHTPSTDKAVVDICTYKRPDLCVVDAAVALTGMHLSGTPKHLGLILAGFDCVATDAIGSELMDRDPNSLKYLEMANGKLGDMHDIGILSEDRSQPHR